jgi:hypothetical protein
MYEANAALRTGRRQILRAMGIDGKCAIGDIFRIIDCGVRSSIDHQLGVKLIQALLHDSAMSDVAFVPGNPRHREVLGRTGHQCAPKLTASP